MLASNEYVWVLEGDIKACFDEIDHRALVGRVRDRVGDKRVIGLIKMFLAAGVLCEDGVTRDTKAGTPQGGIISPLLANIALSVLDDHFTEVWQRDMATRTCRAARRRHGEATYRLIRYADDFVIMVAGTKAHTEVLRDRVTEVLSPMGLRLSEEKTMVVHIDEGFEFLGFRIQRQTKRGSNKAFVYTWPSRKSLSSIMAKVKKIARQGTNNPLSDLLRQLNGVLRGWTNYFRHGVSKDTFQYLAQYSWERVVHWLRRKHRRANWGWLRRRYLANRWWPEHEGVALLNCGTVPVTRYRYRGKVIPSKWVTTSNVT
jgi:RNA-directed DNA polymerase